MPSRAFLLLPCLTAALLPAACTRGPGAPETPDASLADAGPATNPPDAAASEPAGSPGPPPPPTPAPDASESPLATLPGPCASAQDSTPISIQLTGQEDKAPLRIEPDPGLGSAKLYKRVDLNGDGREDLLLRFPAACGNHGECPIGIYMNCAEGLYARLWGPEYAVDLVVQAGQGPWRVLKWSQSGDEGKATFKKLRYGQGAYQEP